MEIALLSSIPIKIITYGIPFIYIFLGLNSNLNQIKKLKSNNLQFATGLLIQLIFLPILGYLISTFYSYSLIASMMFFILILPGGNISAYLTYIKKGKIELSILLTSASTIISVFLIPIWLKVFFQSNKIINFEVKEILIQLIVFIFTPFLLGVIISHTLVKSSYVLKKILDPTLKFLIILVSFWVPYDFYEFIKLYFFDGLLLSIATLLIIYLFLSLILRLFKFEDSIKSTIKLEAITQNFALSLFLSVSLNIPEILILGIIYYIVSTFFAIIYTFSNKI